MSSPLDTRPLRSLALVSALLAAPAAGQSDVAYVHSADGSAWGTNEAAYTDTLDDLFPDQVDDFVYESLDPDELFDPDRLFIYLEGSHDMAEALAAFLGEHRKALEAWVRKGGRLFLNSAPNVGESFDLPFQARLHFEGDSGAKVAVATQQDHPLFDGPVAIEGREFTGGGSSHAHVTGKKLTPLLHDDAFRTVLGVMRQGKGQVALGGLTTPNYWDPQPEAQDMRANSLAWFSGRQLPPEDVKFVAKVDFSDDEPTDSLKLKVRRLALGDIDLEGTQVFVDLDGVGIGGALDAKGRTSGFDGETKISIRVKDGRRGSVQVTLTRADMSDRFESPHVGPLDAKFLVDLPLALRVGDREFTATVPTEFSGAAGRATLRAKP